jgi:hypothetical protein
MTAGRRTAKTALYCRAAPPANIPRTKTRSPSAALVTTVSSVGRPVTRKRRVSARWPAPTQARLRKRPQPHMAPIRQKSQSRRG